MKTNKFQITADGLKTLKQELTELKEHKRPEAIERVARAREFGDLSENSEYHAAREDLSFIEGRINELEEMLKQAKVAKSSKSKDKIAIGCKVTLVTDSNQEHTYEIVGEWEANPMEKKISHTSPLGQALIGKKAGDRIEFEAPAGKVVYQVKKIH